MIDWNGKETAKNLKADQKKMRQSHQTEPKSLRMTPLESQIESSISAVVVMIKRNASQSSDKPKNWRQRPGQFTFAADHLRLPCENVQVFLYLKTDGSILTFAHIIWKLIDLLFKKLSILCFRHQNKTRVCLHVVMRGTNSETGIAN